MGKVTMFHPQSGVTQEASEDAFRRQWSNEGWELVETPKPPRKKSTASRNETVTKSEE